MQVAIVSAVEFVLSAEGRKCRESSLYGTHRQAVPGNALVWLAADGAVYAAAGPQMRAAQGASLDAPDAVGADLSDAQHQQEAPSAQDLSLFAQEYGH